MGQPTKFPPNTIHTGGPKIEVNDVAAGGAITPGMLIERYNSTGTPLFRAHSVAGGAGSTYALNQSMLNKGVDDPYAIGDLVEAAVLQKGSTAWALIASGANIANGDPLSSNANGTLKAASGTTIAIALESKNNSAGPGNARIRVEVV